ncbi:pyridoxamine 5-phosphate oxidase, partial [archaeon]|nr:pyridoxamine 5-phosphate oxidase [archaeon]
ANPKFEISTASKEYQSIRINGVAKFITGRESKEAIVASAPNLKSLSKELDGIVIFYADEAEATLWSISGEMRAIKL